MVSQRAVTNTNANLLIFVSFFLTSNSGSVRVMQRVRTRNTTKSRNHHRALHGFDFVWDFDISWPCCLLNLNESEREGGNFVQSPIETHVGVNMGLLRKSV